jgi:hypothetical protein
LARINNNVAITPAQKEHTNPSDDSGRERLRGGADSSRLAVATSEGSALATEERGGVPAVRILGPASAVKHGANSGSNADNGSRPLPNGSIVTMDRNHASGGPSLLCFCPTKRQAGFRVRRVRSRSRSLCSALAPTFSFEAFRGAS